MSAVAAVAVVAAVAKVASVADAAVVSKFINKSHMSDFGTSILCTTL